MKKRPVCRKFVFGIHQEKNKARGGELPKLKNSGFEPFVAPKNPLEPPQQEGVSFVNLYGGNFAQKMELNRKAVERALQIVHLDGQVFLTSLIPSRQRSIGVNPDGSVSAKRSLVLGEKIEEDGKDNPLYKVVSVPQGWKVEINDQKLTEELTEKEKLTGKELQRAFIKKFNGVLKKGLLECIWREKLSDVKDKDLWKKILTTFVMPLLGTWVFYKQILAYGIDATALVGILTVSCVEYAVFNVGTKFTGLKEGTRKLDHVLEYILPQAEVDKVARAFVYLETKGRRLVRETREEK